MYSPVESVIPQIRALSLEAATGDIIFYLYFLTISDQLMFILNHNNFVCLCHCLLIMLKDCCNITYNFCIVWVIPIVMQLCAHLPNIQTNFNNRRFLNSSNLIKSCILFYKLIIVYLFICDVNIYSFFCINISSKENVQTYSKLHDTVQDILFTIFFKIFLVNAFRKCKF